MMIVGGADTHGQTFVTNLSLNVIYNTYCFLLLKRRLTHKLALPFHTVLFAET